MTPSLDVKSAIPVTTITWPVVLVAGLIILGLLAVSGSYGFHGDEMYYIVAGQHPAFGYVDMPPLTPLLSAASVALLGVSPTAVRLLPALEVALIVVLVALIARDLGGSRRAQLLAAITAALSGYLGAGHLNTTTEPDLLAWAIILWLLVKLLAGGDGRLWLAVGITTGVGLENKDTLLFLGAGLAVGLVLARRWDVMRSPWAWAALGIALLLWAPNLAWQAANGWPQVTMASRIAGYAAENRAQFLPLLWLFTGPLLSVSAAGLIGSGDARSCTLVGDRDRRSGRARPRHPEWRKGLLRDRQRHRIYGGRREPPRSLAGARPSAPEGRERRCGLRDLGRANRGT